MAKVILRAGKVAIKIIILFAILGLIFYSVKILTPAKAQTEPESSELADELALAETYQEQGKYAEAEQIYQDIITQYPGTDDAFAAQTKLVILYINWDKPTDAEANLEELKSNFYGHPEIAKAVFDIANCYSEEHKNYEKARQLCQLAVDNWPESKYTILARAGMISASIALDKDFNVIEVAEALLEQYSESEFIGEAACSIADTYFELTEVKSYYEATEYENARKLYKIAADNWSGNDDAIWAQAGLISANIYLGDDPNVAEAIDVLLERFSENEFIAEVACSIADSCYDMRKYEDARRLYKFDIESFPENNELILARAGEIRADIALDNHTTAEGEIDMFIADFKDHPDFAVCVSQIEESYYNKVFLVEGLIEDDWLRPLEMWEKALAAVPDFFHDDPDLYYFIGYCYYNLGGYEKALNYCKKIVNKWPDYPHMGHVELMIGYCSEVLARSGGVSK